jgi:hypothetical protein
MGRRKCKSLLENKEFITSKLCVESLPHKVLPPSQIAYIPEFTYFVDLNQSYNIYI